MSRFAQVNWFVVYLGVACKDVTNRASVGVHVTRSIMTVFNDVQLSFK